MIYIGSRGMTALDGMVLGSVTTRVLHLATIPILSGALARGDRKELQVSILVSAS